MATKNKDIIDQFTGFVDKYADEALAVAGGLRALMDAVRPPSNIATPVTNAIDILEAAAKNLSKVKAPAKVTIAKSDIEKAVAATLPSLLNDMVTEAVSKALAEAQANEAVDDDK
jgi:hypothetical protein